MQRTTSELLSAVKHTGEGVKGSSELLGGSTAAESTVGAAIPARLVISRVVVRE